MKFTSFILFIALAQCASSSRPVVSECNTPRLKNGRIRSKGRSGRIIRYSCLADYELVGNKYSTCIRGSWDTPTPICVSTKCPTRPPVPKHGMVYDQIKGAVLMFFCDPGYTLIGDSQLYCDGKQWNGTTPYCRDTKSVAPTSCDFDNSNATDSDPLCWWEGDPKHDFNWIRQNFNTPSTSVGTGPTHDHTLGKGYDGYYMYIEASGRQENETATLYSPLYMANLTETGCFSFWYHMYGTTIGSLNVYFKPETEKTRRLMWSKSGNQGNQWLNGYFNLPTVDSSFQIIIEGVRGQSYISDIAIDDLAILQGDQCAIKNLTVNTTPATDDDELEIYNAMQTCKNRCVNTLSEITLSPEFNSNPDICQCTIDCADTGSCCPDFPEYCVFEATDFLDVVTKAYSSPSESDSKSTTIMATVKNDSTINSSNATTTSKITNSIVRETETTTVETKATSKEPMRTSTIMSKTTVIVETPFFAPTYKTIVATGDTKSAANSHVIIQDAQQLEQSSTFSSLPGIFGILISIMTGFTITAAVILFILRRRKTYKRSSNGSAFSEDSDVHYLTRHEVLDFTMARPADEGI